MTFLVAKIVFLLLAAALFGAWLMYWWLSNRQEDVTESYRELKTRADDWMNQSGELLTRKDLDKGIDSLGSRMDKLRAPDFDPIRARLTSIERSVSNIELPTTDLSPLNERLQYLEAQIAKPDPNFEHLHSRVTGLEETLNYVANSLAQLGNTEEPNFAPVQARLDNIEQAVNNLQAPDVDLGPIHSSLALLELGIEGLDIPATNMEPVHDHIRTLDARLIELSDRLDSARKSDMEVITSRIASLSSTLSTMQIPDVEPVIEHVHAKLNRLEGKIIDLGGVQQLEADFSPVLQQMDQLETRVSAPRADIETLNARLGALEISLSEISGALTGLTMPNLQPIEQRLERMAAFDADQDNARRTELEILASRMAGISKQIDETRPQAVDIRPLQESLSSLEASFRSIDHTKADLSPVIVRLNDVEVALQALRTDMEAIRNIDRKIAELEGFDTDLSPVHGRLVAMESALSDIRGEFNTLQVMIHESKPSELIERKLNSLESALSDLKLQKQSIDIDYGPVLDVVYKMDSRLMDLNAVENRLTSMEYGLAAVHDMLQSRPDISDYKTRTETDVASVRKDSGERSRDLSLQSTATRNFRTSYVGETSHVNADLIRSAIREGDRANLLTSSVFGPADDLELISGVGPMLSALLNNIGVYYFWQIVEWGPDEIDWVDGQLKHFKGRVERDDWVRQARNLMNDPTAARRPV